MPSWRARRPPRAADLQTASSLPDGRRRVTQRAQLPTGRAARTFPARRRLHALAQPLKRPETRITRALLIELAADRGTPLGRRRPAPRELADCETWLVSALHGIQAVTRGAAGGQPAGAAPRAATWQRLLDDFALRQIV